MAANSILDADMATLASWFRTGFGWWVEELRGLVPASLRQRETALTSYLLYRGPGMVERNGRGKHLPLLVDPKLCLIRRLTLPALADSDLRQLVQLDADRILPMPASRLFIAAKADSEDRTAVTVAGLPRESASAMLAEIKAMGLETVRIGLADGRGPGLVAMDLTPSFAEAGLIAPARAAAAGWWAVVAFLFTLNIGMLVWRDAQQVSRLEGLIAEQAPAVRAARTISYRIDQTQRSALELAGLRQNRDAVAVLAAVTQSMPERAWVQRYAWDGHSIRLSGYKRQGVDVIGALRKTPLFTDVRAANAEAIAEVPSGQPFDLTASVRERFP